MACAALIKCAPDGTRVLAFYDSETGAPIAGFLADSNVGGVATPYTGVLTDLVSCPDDNSVASLTLTDPADGSLTFSSGEDGVDPVIIPICDLLDGLEATGAVLPAGVNVLGSDCQWHQIPAGTTDTFSTYSENTTTNVLTITAPDGTTTYDVCTACGTTSSLTDNGDGTITHDPGDGSTLVPISICDLLDDLEIATNPLPDGSLFLADDCKWYPMGAAECCYVSSTLTDPATCDPVTAIMDVSDVTAITVTYVDVNGQEWTGDQTTLNNEPCGATASDLCADIAALPDLAATAKAASTVGVDDAGNCVLVEATPVVYADAAGNVWDENNAAWVDPTTCPEFTELRVYNDPASGGTAIYRNLEETLGAATGLQWHQTA